MSVIQIAANAVTAKLLNADRPAKLAVSELLSYVVEGFEHTNTYKTKNWDGRSSFFEFRAATFPAGFVAIVRKRLINLGYQIQIVRKRPPEPLGDPEMKVDDFPYDPRYGFQDETVERLLRYGQMIAQVATGGGKSRIAKKATKRINRPTLFLTTRSVLMYQMKDHYDSAGMACGVLGDSEWTPRKFNVGMVQTFTARLENLTLEEELERYIGMMRSNIDRQVEEHKMWLRRKGTPNKKIAESCGVLREKLSAAGPSDAEIAKTVETKHARNQALRAQTIRLLEKIEFVIGEEAHEAGGNSYYEILRHCRNAHYRLALTATPFMRDDAEDNMRLMAAFGPIGIRVSEKELIDKGILATPRFKFVDLSAPPKVRRTTAWQRAYSFGVVKNDGRNRHICVEAMRAARRGLTTLILVQRKEHGRILKDALKKAGVKVDFIFGDHDQAERQAALNKLKDGRIDVLIGSTILDVGVDVPAIGMLILAGGGKAEVGTRQRIGRGLRAKKIGSNVCYVLDFTDVYNDHLKRHALTRHEIIASTPGFDVNILPNGVDFPFEDDGFKRAA